MTPKQLRRCVALGNAIADGTEDLVDLDAKSLTVISLELRGKKQKAAGNNHNHNNKRKRELTETGAPEKTRASPKKRQISIRNALSAPQAAATLSTRPSTLSTPTAHNVQELEPQDTDLTTLVTTSDLSPFRQRLLLALCQVPRGRFTTYAALSDHLHSSARAVGSGLRNNPFAPRVPCHRVVAADRSLGGFGGGWGMDGKFAEEKIRLLREEGVIVDVAKGRVEGEIWKTFR
ncbi:MAG: hypothetical protein Q9223_002943 [Gallowayella weberi]